MYYKYYYFLIYNYQQLFFGSANYNKKKGTEGVRDGER